MPEEHREKIENQHSVIKQRPTQIKPELQELTEKYQNIVNEQIHNLSQSFETIEMPLQRTSLRPSRLDKNTNQSTLVVTTTAEHIQANMQPMNVTQTTQQNIESATNTTPTMTQAQQNVELVMTSTVLTHTHTHKKIDGVNGNFPW